MDKQKTSLIDAIVKLGSAQADAILETTEGQIPMEISVGDVDETFKDLQKWADVTN